MLTRQKCKIIASRNKLNSPLRLCKGSHLALVKDNSRFHKTAVSNKLKAVVST